MKRINYQALTRILAFLAVSSAIAAVAWLIKDYTLLAIGVTGLAAGHYYSWKRPEASIVRSLILLGFMVLTVFLGGDILRSGLADRLLLSRYLVYGLVIGSFDLMRRRNVMASLILGILLMVLISEFALNLWFFLFLVPFIVLTLSSAMVGRLDRESGDTEVVGGADWTAAAGYWMGAGIATVLLAALLFLLIPRVTSNQVAQASWLPSRLDLTLSGPAFLPSQPGAPVSPGILPFTQGGPGSTYTPLGYAGSFADQVVMNVRSRISSYWRGLTLDVYDGQGWLSSSSSLNLRLSGDGSYLMPDSRAYAAGQRGYWQVYYMLSAQPYAVFTGYNPVRIYLPEAEVVLDRGTLYRSLSTMPFVTPDRLRRDRALSLDAAYLSLPPITERTASLADSIMLGEATDYDKAAALERFLSQNYPYSLEVGPLPPGRDAVDYFLFEQRAGYCAQFATAMAVMARHVGLPARVAAGYLPGYIDPLTGAHIVRAGDAHAWVEIFFQGHGWVAFDPTPRADAAMGFAGGKNPVYFGLEDFTGASLTEILSPLGADFSLGRLKAAGWLWLVGGGLAIAVVLLLLRMGARRKRRPEAGFSYTSLEGRERETALKLYRQLVRMLGRRGLPGRISQQSLLEYAAEVSRYLPEERSLIDRFTALALNAAYNPGPFPVEDLEALRRDYTELKARARPVKVEGARK